MEIEVLGGVIRRVGGNKAHPISHGKLCEKCTLAYNSTWLDRAARLTRPLLRDGPKGMGRFEPVSWEEALSLVAGRISEAVRTCGAHSVVHAHYTGTCGEVAGKYEDSSPNTTASSEPARRDHARECMVRTGRTSSNLGRQPDPPGTSHSRARLGAAPVRTTVSRPWSRRWDSPRNVEYTPSASSGRWGPPRWTRTRSATRRGMSPWSIRAARDRNGDD